MQQSELGQNYIGRLQGFSFGAPDGKLRFAFDFAVDGGKGQAPNVLQRVMYVPEVRPGEPLDATTAKRFEMIEELLLTLGWDGVTPWEKLTLRHFYLGDVVVSLREEEYVNGRGKTVKQLRVAYVRRLGNERVPASSRQVAGAFDAFRSWQQRKTGSGVAHSGDGEITGDELDGFAPQEDDASPFEATA